MTVPVPVPALATVRLKLVVNVAVTDFAAAIETEQVAAAPVQAPAQLESLDPLAGVAVSVTRVPEL